jgi:hypothetical protein
MATVLQEWGHSARFGTTAKNQLFRMVINKPKTGTQIQWQKPKKK